MPGATAAEEPRLLPSRRVLEAMPALLPSLPVQTSANKLSAERLYERALPLTVQIFALKP